MADRIIEDEEIEDDLLDEFLNGNGNAPGIEIAAEPPNPVKIDKKSWALKSKISPGTFNGRAVSVSLPKHDRY
ncbi:conserved hypothetical protein [delta proteobacterium NaphS2]|nr:conserved hypothetical protein [delta proteobacterium NaphS2]